MHFKSFAAAAVCAAAAAVVLCSPAAKAQDRSAARRVMPGALTELRAYDAEFDRMLRGGDLRVRDSRPDALVPRRRIERADQYHRGVRVFGGDVARQIDAGQTVSIFGTLYDNITVDANPAVHESAARATVEERAGVRLGTSRAGELVVLPLETGGHALTWRLRAFDGTDLREYFVDAHSGRIIFDYSDLQTQAEVGRATGVLGDSKKMSGSRLFNGFVADDLLRPPSIRTYDLKGNAQRTTSIINGVLPIGQSDLGADDDNIWTDGALTDAHIYTGYTYDYFFKRFNRRGLNNNNIRMLTIVHPARREEWNVNGSRYPLYYANAAYYGNAQVIYGVGLPSNVTAGGRTWNFTSAALDIVAHELTHGVTDYTSDLVYMNESGALNESFSDIMGTAVEFMFHPAPGTSVQPDYLCGEDAVRPAGIRSLANPSAYGHPDHYSVRYTGSADGGGVHINSSIPNHAFYLAIEGGTNRVSGQMVQGVGAANRVQAETVFYRAMTQLLPSNATFTMARAATIQAARDLYGANSAIERSLTQAWTAVGVN